MNDPEMCIIALNILPADTPAYLAQALEGHQDYVMLKMLIEKQETFLSDHSRSHNLRVQFVTKIMIETARHGVNAMLSKALTS